MILSDNDEKQGVIQLEISIEKLESLFNKGELCAAEINCLNYESKKCIWNLCLSSCAKRMLCNPASLEAHAYHKKSTEKQGSKLQL